MQPKSSLSGDQQRRRRNSGAVDATDGLESRRAEAVAAGQRTNNDHHEHHRDEFIKVSQQDPGGERGQSSEIEWPHGRRPTSGRPGGAVRAAELHAQALCHSGKPAVCSRPPPSAAASGVPLATPLESWPGDYGQRRPVGCETVGTLAPLIASTTETTAATAATAAAAAATPTTANPGLDELAGAAGSSGGDGGGGSSASSSINNTNNSTGLHSEPPADGGGRESGRISLDIEHVAPVAGDNEAVEERTNNSDAAELERRPQQQQQQQQQRIKVTLSKPKWAGDSSPALQDQDKRLKRKQRDSAESAEFTLDRVAIEPTGRHFSQAAAGSSEKCRSTATLISAIGSIEPAQLADQESAWTSEQPCAKLSRSEQEDRLRRIASQRKRTGTSGERTVAQVAHSQVTQEAGHQRQQQQQHRQRQPDTAGRKQNTAPAASECDPAQRAAGAASAAVQEDCPKQLAIYINGKIRSNSIFCSRSVSSNSFSGLLKSIHAPANASSEAQRRAGSEQAHQWRCADTEGQLEGAHSSREAKRAESNRAKLKWEDSTSQKKAHSFVTCLIARRTQNANLVPLIQHLLSKPIRLLDYGRRLAESGKADREQKELAEDERGHREPRATSLNQEGAEGRRPAAGRQCSEFGEKLGPAPRLVHPEEGRPGVAGGCAQPECGEEPRTYKLNPSSMFLRKAMRYYRLWIYCANLTIFLGTTIFLLSALYVASDYRFALIVKAGSGGGGGGQAANDSHDQAEPASGPPTDGATPNRSAQAGPLDADQPDWPAPFGIGFGEPALLLAYLAIALQLGLLQALGCFGAIRMQERLIQAFWYLILALIAFDVVYLLYWLQRYNVMLTNLQEQMSHRLENKYGERSASLLVKLGDTYNSTGQPISGRDDSRRSASEWHFDGEFSEIFDRIQRDSRCCGIHSSLDFRHTKWRRMKVEQLAMGFGDASQDAELRNLLHQVPLVPASCCRAENSVDDAPPGQPVIHLDDSQLAPKVRVPAWSPSLVVDDLATGRRQAAPRSWKLLGAQGGQVEGERATLADVIDRRWSGRRVAMDEHEELAQDDGQRSDAAAAADHEDTKLSSRLKAKRLHYDRPSELASESTEFIDGSGQMGPAPDLEERRKRHTGQLERDDDIWPLETSAPEKNTRLATKLAQLIDATRDENFSALIWPLGPAGQSGRLDTGAGGEGVLSKRVEVEEQLEEIRRLLFRTIGDGGDSDDEDADDELLVMTNETFKWPNELRLTFEQFKLVEGFIVAQLDELGQQERPRGAAKVLARRSVADEPDDAAQEARGGGRAARDRLRRIRELIGQAGGCAPRSHYDEALIYTRGCQHQVRAWFQWSANVLFVMGFCVLTVLKFCSLILLRLEIREMIHKIRVLKGMATEYNALQDLEPYLPRPSVSYQAAELTPAGVAATGSSSTATLGAGNCPPADQISGAGPLGASSSSPTNTIVPPLMAPRRLGGSFSEAVAAATAVAQHQRLAEQHQQHLQHHLRQHGRTGSLVNCARAASTKTIGGSALTANGLTLTACGVSGSARAHRLNSATLCPCVSGSLSVAHLNQSGTLQHQRQQACSLRSDLFPASAMPRRHTAISVCPAAAAAAAAAAASPSNQPNSMLRRGTYTPLAQPLNPEPAGGDIHRQSQNQLVAGGQHRAQASANMLQAKSLNYLNHHRHSANADAIQAPSSLLFDAVATFGPRRPSKLLSSQQEAPLDETDVLVSLSKQELKQRQKQQQQQPPKPQQKLLLDPKQEVNSPPLKRQSSSGAQSAVNFSLDISAPNLTESRRSIH